MEILPQALMGRRPGRIRPSLDRLTAALQRLQLPQRKFCSALIVGTNGKGSTAAMLERVLSAGGIRTGLATSPHLIRVHERIRVDGSEIESDRLEAVLERLRPFPELTFFETLTAAAFLHFADSEVEVAVLEAGMGGRWDATRTAGSAVAGLTNVGTDHQQWLGDRPEEIADDKGAALAAADRAVYGPQVAPWVKEHLNLPGVKEAGSLVEIRESALSGTFEARWPGTGWNVLGVPLEGEHQRDNLHLALAMAESCRTLGWIPPVDPMRVAEAVNGLRWPGRLSQVQISGRAVLLDGAHNLEAVEALAAYLRGQPIRYNLVFACLDDKPLGTMAAILRPLFGDVAVCPLRDPRSMSAEALVEAFPGAKLCSGPLEALERLGDPVIAVGSLRLVGEFLSLGG